MAVLTARPNAGKPWSTEDVETLRSLAEAGAPLRQIADRFGRTRESVSRHAAKHGITIGKNRIALNAERDEARRNGEDDPPPA